MTTDKDASTRLQAVRDESKTLPTDRLLNAREVAELLNVPERWVRDHTRSGAIPCVALGHYRRYDRGDVLAWLETVKQGGGMADWQRIRPRQYLRAVPSARNAA